MKKTLDELCGQLTFNEATQLIFSRWYKMPGEKSTRINYTFNANHIPSDLKTIMERDFPAVIMKTPPDFTQKFVRESLGRWEASCDQLIVFNYVNNPSPTEWGITFVACENMVVDGSTTFNFGEQIIGNEMAYFKHALVCLPPKLLDNYNLKTVSHEIGHALGMLHVHEVQSLSDRLMAIDQGMGCSVMGYNNILESPFNACTTEYICRNETYAIYPGPLDKQLCTAMYYEEETIQPSTNSYMYFHSLFAGFLNGAMEKGLSELLANIKYNDEPLLAQNSADKLALLGGIFYRTYTQQSGAMLTSTLALIELCYRLNGNNQAGLLGLMRTLASMSSLMMTLYELYPDEALLIKTLSLAACLTAQYSGSLLAPGIGKNAALAVNATLKGIGSLFSQSVCSVRYTFKNSFFSPPVKEKSASLDAPIEYFNVFD